MLVFPDWSDRFLSGSRMNWLAQTNRRLSYTIDSYLDRVLFPKLILDVKGEKIMLLKILHQSNLSQPVKFIDIT